jgi:hypothetical protein
MTRADFDVAFDLRAWGKLPSLVVGVIILRLEEPVTHAAARHGGGRSKNVGSFVDETNVDL